MFSRLFPERCQRCGVSYAKASRECNNGYIAILSGPGRLDRDPHIWPRSKYKFSPYTEEQYAEILAWVMSPDD